MDRALLIMIAIAFAGIGAWALVTPEAALDAVSVVARDSTGIVELRAMYGGLQLGAAAFLVWCAGDAARVRTGLVGAMLLIGGLGGVRALGLVVDRPDSVLMWVFVGLELSAAALCAALLRPWGS